MKETIAHFKTLLPCEQFVVTGSYALALYGLMELDKVKDLDIILVNPSDESLNILTRLQADSTAKTKPKADAELKAILVHNGVKVDIFALTKKQETNQLPDFEVAKVNHIVAAKKSYKRMKDELQLRKIAKLFFDQNDFIKFLDSEEAIQSVRDSYAN